MAQRVGLVLVAHRYDRESTAHLRTLLADVTDGPGQLAGIGHTSLDDVTAAARALRGDGCDGIALLPMIVHSESSTAHRVVQAARDLATMLGMAVVVAPALDAAAEIVEVLTDRAHALASDDASSSAVVLVGHGPTRDDDLAVWERTGMTVAAGVRDRGGFARVRAEFVRDDAGPPVRAAAVRGLRECIAQDAMATGRDVIVVPWIVGAGRLARERLPEDLAGLAIRFDGRPMLPHPALERWVSRQLAAAVTAFQGAARGTTVVLPRAPT
ncbi:MAG: hypothetical protein OEY20_15450 [Gemmatimonadota bacterium]|nr:hypothetical protein [Gemmatimonadota bacterium]MDH5198636.1 hypothetical protein [Gemmatimonadota bacterium]